MSKAFDFGKNWHAYSTHALTEEKFGEARKDFQALLAPADPLSGRSFLDIGFGQGLSIISASLEGAEVYGVDINPLCRNVLLENARRLDAPQIERAKVAVGSILDRRVVEEVRSWCPDGFDVVHSWGVLHHTGDMWTAIDNAAGLVRPGGTLVLAIYNRHWSSPLWTVIKRLYVSVPGIIQRLMIACSAPVIYLAKLLVTRRNPLQKQRGMNFYYDVIDWVGGYPYEYASEREIVEFMEARGFQLTSVAAAEVPTGCNEFLFLRAQPAVARD